MSNDNGGASPGRCRFDSSFAGPAKRLCDTWQAFGGGGLNGQGDKGKHKGSHRLWRNYNATSRLIETQSDILQTMEQPTWNFEQEPYTGLHDESSVNLRAYFDRMDDEKMQQYKADWTDEQLMEWDENFKDDGALMLICSERDIDVEEYRQQLEASQAYRQRVR